VTAVVLRPLAASDSLESLTAMLHRAYARLGALGLNYTAVDQSVLTTRDRVEAGQCFVLDAGGELAGSVVVAGPFDEQKNPGVRASPWYLRRDVAHLHQLAVDPAHQGQGHGERLIAACEDWARERGYRGIALDTAVPAAHLRARYERLGYATVDEVQWRGKRYRSVVMLKSLTAPAPTLDDPEHRCALVHALWAHVQARDWTAMRAAFAEGAVTHWPVTGECFRDADTLVRVNAEYPEGWSIEVKTVDALVDGRVHSLVEVPQGDQRFFAHSRFTFDGARIAALTEHWAQAEAPPAWRSTERMGSAYQRMAVT
jgi:GNAT superfamily N-acetyltransferase